MGSREAVVVAAVRTPVGRLGGALASVRPDDLAGLVLAEVLKKTPGLDPALIALVGSALPAARNSLSARLLVLTVLFVMLAEVLVFAPSIVYRPGDPWITLLERLATHEGSKLGDQLFSRIAATTRPASARGTTATSLPSLAT